MTQVEIVWLLVAMIQSLVIGFVTYWMRRVQRLEDMMADTIEARTKLMVEYQGRVSRLEEQYAQIIGLLARIEKRLDGHSRRMDEDNQEE